MKKVLFAMTISCSFSTNLLAMDNTYSDRNMEALVSRLETSSETISQKQDILADNFMEIAKARLLEDISNKTLVRGPYEVIKEINYSFKKPPLPEASDNESNLSILRDTSVQSALKKFTDSRVEPLSKEISQAGVTVTKTWCEDYRKEFHQTDLVALVKERLFSRFLEQMQHDSHHGTKSSF